MCVSAAADKAPVKVLRSSPYRRREEQGFLLLLLLQILIKKDLLDFLNFTLTLAETSLSCCIVYTFNSFFSARLSM